jgi:hypothetical protein
MVGDVSRNLPISAVGCYCVYVTVSVRADVVRVRCDSLYYKLSHKLSCSDSYFTHLKVKLRVVGCNYAAIP